MRREQDWDRRDLGELVDVLDNRRVPLSATERASRPGDVPYYGAAGQVGWIDDALFDEPLVLLGEDGVQFFDRNKTKAYPIAGRAWVNNHAHVLRARIGLINQRFLLHYLNWFDYTGFANGTTRLKLTQSAMRRIPVTFPPIDDQQRIVEILEDHLSRLDAALQTLNAVAARLRPFLSALLQQIVPTGAVQGWRLTTVGEAGQVQLGRQRHPDWHTGPEMKPYLRVANIFEDRIDTRDVMEMDFSGVFERYRLTPGDVLLNEGQSPEFLGRPAIYRGEPPDVAFTNSLIRFKANNDVLPEWALLVFRRHMHAGRFMKESRITTNIAHLSASRLKSVEFPVPPLTEQQALVDLANDHFSAIERLRVELARHRKQERVLRRSLLEAAFSGHLTRHIEGPQVTEELSCV